MLATIKSLCAIFAVLCYHTYKTLLIIIKIRIASFLSSTNRFIKRYIYIYIYIYIYMNKNLIYTYTLFLTTQPSRSCERSLVIFFLFSGFCLFELFFLFFFFFPFSAEASMWAWHLSAISRRWLIAKTLWGFSGWNPKQTRYRSSESIGTFA